MEMVCCGCFSLLLSVGTSGDFRELKINCCMARFLNIVSEYRLRRMSIFNKRNQEEKKRIFDGCLQLTINFVHKIVFELLRISLCSNGQFILP